MANQKKIKVPDFDFTGTPDGTKFACGDGSWKDAPATGEPPQIIITVTSTMNTSNLDGSSVGQKGKNTIIDNGANPITFTVNGSTGFCASYVKGGAGAIQFVAGGGRTLVTNGTAYLLGAAGISTATIVSFGTVDYLKIDNW